MIYKYCLVPYSQMLSKRINKIEWSCIYLLKKPVNAYEEKLHISQYHKEINAQEKLR